MIMQFEISRFQMMLRVRVWWRN